MSPKDDSLSADLFEHKDNAPDALGKTRNKTLVCTPDELESFGKKILTLDSPVNSASIESKVIQGDFFGVAKWLPRHFVDLLVLDPPYNLTKNYNGTRFGKMSAPEYSDWFGTIIDLIKPMLKPTASVYVCADWQTSGIIFPILEEKLLVRNRITWEREKGRGAKSNWKNNSEDIWFCTASDEYHFDVDAVKMRRKVIAPYRVDGKPKDWQERQDGDNYRLTHPSNLWTDITVPFWSMPENTNHPTQKPEKLIAKLILASSKQGDFVFDPFLGSGTTAVAAGKLNRKWCGVDINGEYLCWTLKRLQRAERDSSIQGYRDGIFWERNSLPQQNAKAGG